MKLQYITKSIHLKVGRLSAGFYPMAFVGYRDHWQKFSLTRFGKYGFSVEFGPFYLEYI